MAVRGIQTGRAGVTTGVRAKNLKVWLHEATRKKELVIQWWEKLISIMQVEFQEVRPP